MMNPQRFEDHIRKVSFSELNLHDLFFTSLRNAYQGFDDWFDRKSAEGEKTWVSRNRDSGHLQRRFVKGSPASKAGGELT